MNRRFAILSSLLRYPDEGLRADLPDITAAIGEAGFAPVNARALLRLARRLGAGDPLDRQEDYVRLFDRTRSTSLHLFEHVHGDSRNRGPAMIELAQAYQGAGFAITGNELPDYLPLFLEFLAVAPAELGAALLSQAAPIIDQLHGRLLARTQAPARAYAAVPAAALAEAGVAPQARQALADDATDADDLGAIDAAYEDAPVVFGPENDPDRGNVRASMSAMISRLKRLRASGAL
ncbi:MAG: nitrate reductase molybdenum cofactor assembly chaperone [Acetobacteraceae bacterium]|nr:nitrate reductase molybdenum cofactor assembly chaperone [Acetobacteraceae bacterium]